ncbi:MAG: hypothetical protein IK127_04135 [Clostridia bacterium]|nr:hypothetical protein [Clostridia bacterium]
MQNYGNGQPQQQPQQPQQAQPVQQPQQPQYQYPPYGGYPYPPKRQGDGGILALLGFIFSLTAVLFLLVALILGAFASSKGAVTTYIIFMFLTLAFGGTGLAFSIVSYVKQKGKKIFYLIGLLAGAICVMLFFAYFITTIQAIRGLSAMGYYGY